MNVHRAQINIGRLRAPLDDPKMVGFVAQLDPINALADAAPGFVWRLQSASGNATELAYKRIPQSSSTCRLDLRRSFAQLRLHIQTHRRLSRPRQVV
jgi:hypothetical protein